MRLGSPPSTVPVFSSKNNKNNGGDYRTKKYRGGGYKTGNMCGYKTGIMCGYKTNHSKNFCAGTTAIRPITRKLRKFRKKIEIWCICRKKIFGFFKTQYLQKVIFADLTFIRPITRNWSGNDLKKQSLENSDSFMKFSRKFQFLVKFSNFCKRSFSRI